MLTRKQDELFSHAARLALRGNHAARDGDKPSSLRPLLESWVEIQSLARVPVSASRRVAERILQSVEQKRPAVANGKADNDLTRQFGLECVLLFKICRGDDPLRFPLEFGDYY